jgi:hypothetical protein
MSQSNLTWIKQEKPAEINFDSKRQAPQRLRRPSKSEGRCNPFGTGYGASRRDDQRVLFVVTILRVLLRPVAAARVLPWPILREANREVDHEVR